MIFLQTQTKLSKTARFPCCCCCRTRSKKRTITENKSNLGETDSGVHAKRTILIPKCSNQDERKWIGDLFFLFALFQRYLPKKKQENQRRREKTLCTCAEKVFAYLSGTDVLTLTQRESERCRNRGKTTSVESCNRHTHTHILTQL